MSQFGLVVFWIVVYAAAMTTVISDLIYGFFGLSMGTVFMVWGLCFLSGVVLSEYVIKTSLDDEK